jgi:multidrug resistance efflux pump
MKRKAAQKSHECKRSYLRHAVPVVVWLIAATSVVWLFDQRMQRFQVIGIARGQVLQISPSSTGRIRNIAVKLFDPVVSGQTLAVVDTILDNEQTEEAKLRAELASVTAEIGHLTAQLIPTQQQMQAEASNQETRRAGDLGRLAMDVDGYRLQVLRLQVSIANDQMTLRNFASEIKVLGQLAGEDMVAPYQVEKVKVQHETLAQQIETNERMLAQARADLAQAEQRLEEFKQREIIHPSEDYALEVIHKQIGVQGERMDGLIEQINALKSREAVELKSPIDGIIIPIPSRDNDALHQRPGEQVMRQMGEVVRAGDPVLVVAQKEPTEIVAYVNEQQLGLLRQNMPVELVKTTSPAQIARSKIASIGPTVELIPQRLWRSPNLPQWGRPVLIGIPPGLVLVPGEVVGIRGL